MNIFKIPSYLQDFVSSYDKISYKIWNDLENTNINSFRKDIRNHYLDEQNLTCFYCKQYIFSKNGLHWQVEHILPKSLFPQFLLEPINLIVICPTCNSEKGDQNPLNGNNACNKIKYPSKGSRFKIIHPFYDNYEEHIDKIPANHCDYPDHYFLRALTKKGKNTVKTCDLNRFYQEFTGYKDMKGKQIESTDKFIEDSGISKLSKKEQRELVQKIINSWDDF